MNLEPHHRRIHRKVRAIHYGLLPLTLLLVPAWIYAYSMCADEEAPAAACRLLRAGPFAPVLFGAVVLAFVAWDLAKVSHEAHFERHGARPARHSLKHVANGYREIGAHHRRHIHWAVLQLLAVALGIALWIAYKSRQAGY
jgi:hypothetical protein